MYAYAPPSYEKVNEVPKAKRRAQFARRFAPAQLKETLRSTSPHTVLSCRVHTRGVRPFPHTVQVHTKPPLLLCHGH